MLGVAIVSIAGSCKVTVDLWLGILKELHAPRAPTPPACDPRTGWEGAHGGLQFLREP